jgi:hypothetical protein
MTRKEFDERVKEYLIDEACPQHLGLKRDECNDYDCSGCWEKALSKITDGEVTNEKR